MFVVLDDEDVELRLFRLSETPGADPVLIPNTEITATFDLDEDRVVVRCPESGGLHPSARPGKELACYISNGSTGPNKSGPANTSELNYYSGPFPLLLLEVTTDRTPAIQAYFYPADSVSLNPCEIEVVRLEADLFSRVKGIFDTRILEPKTVAVIGVGSGGSLGAMELAKAGVGNFILVDFDRLKAHNIARHVCGISDIGRYKTRAVRDVILEHNPRASVVCHEADIIAADGLLEEIVAASDLVFVATDNQLSRYLINEACLLAVTPAMYGGAYERAFAGEVIRVVPGEAGCYACVRQSMVSTIQSISPQQEVDYTDEEGLVAEPGLGLDVSFIALIHAKLALLTMLRGTDSTLEDIDADMILWINSARPQDGELFERPLLRHFVRVAKNQDCPACGDLALLNVISGNNQGSPVEQGEISDVQGEPS